MFVKAKESGKLKVTYWDQEGASVTYIGGNRTWRNQNPGNIGSGSWAIRHGAIGKAGGFAVFPNYEVGRNAIFEILSSPDFINQSIWDAIPHYAPASSNDVKWYRNLIQKKTSLDLTRKIKSLSKKEFESLVNAIENAEGKFKPGKIIKNSNTNKIISVRKNKHGIIEEYLLQNLGWLRKREAIRLASIGEIDAVIVKTKSGNTYLRSRPDKKAENNLENLG